MDKSENKSEKNGGYSETRTFGQPLKIISLMETDSTNNYAKRLIEDGKISDHAVIIAKSQSAGRGRSGKLFLSPSGGLYMTVVMETELPPSCFISVTSCAAAAVHRAVLQVSGADCGIKWINDLYLRGKKLSGILVESIIRGGRTYVVVGIGVNIGHIALPIMINGISLEDCGYKADVMELCTVIAENILAVREDGFDFGKYVDYYRAHSIVTGQRIAFIRNGSAEYGIAGEVDCHGRLPVDCGGEIKLLDSGEISVRF